LGLLAVDVANGALRIASYGKTMSELLLISFRH